MNRVYLSAIVANISQYSPKMMICNNIETITECIHILLLTKCSDYLPRTGAKSVFCSTDHKILQKISKDIINPTVDGRNTSC